MPGQKMVSLQCPKCKKIKKKKKNQKWREESREKYCRLLWLPPPVSVPQKYAYDPTLQAQPYNIFSSGSHRRKRPNCFFGNMINMQVTVVLCSLLVLNATLKKKKKKDKCQCSEEYRKVKNFVYAAGARAPRSCFNSEMSCILDMPVTRQSPFIEIANGFSSLAAWWQPSAPMSQTSPQKKRIQS